MGISEIKMIYLQHINLFLMVVTVKSLIKNLVGLEHWYTQTGDQEQYKIELLLDDDLNIAMMLQAWEKLMGGVAVSDKGQKRPI